MEKEILFESWCSDTKIMIIKKFSIKRTKDGNGGRGRNQQYYIIKSRQGRHNISARINKTIASDLLKINEKRAFYHCFNILQKRVKEYRCKVGSMRKPVEFPNNY